MSEPPPLDVVGHIGALRRFARALTRDDASADDLVQESLLRAIERADTFRAGGSLRAWLAGILRNQFIDSRRRQAAEARRDDALAAGIGDAQDEGDQEHAVELRLLADRFHELPERHRTVLHLVAVEGLSYQEAAEALAVPIGTIMSRLSRARSALRQPASANRGRASLRIVGGDDA